LLERHVAIVIAMDDETSIGAAMKTNYNQATNPIQIIAKQMAVSDYFLIAAIIIAASLLTAHQAGAAAGGS
jgi:hypothetical protein